jgi:glutathione S-transferase
MSPSPTHRPVDSNHPFWGCTLLASLRSPFARRVRVAFIEHGLSYHEEMEDVFRPSERLLSHNPLARVPVAILRSGVSICESQQILNAFGANAFGAASSAPAYDPNAAALSGLMTGLCDKIVERLLESMKPAHQQDKDVFTDFDRLLPPTLTRLELLLELLGEGLPEAGEVGSLSQAHIDAGVALAYLSLRVSTDWRRGFGAAAEFLDRIERRASFRKTAPPPA